MRRKSYRQVAIVVDGGGAFIVEASTNIVPTAEKVAAKMTALAVAAPLGPGPSPIPAGGTVVMEKASPVVAYINKLTRTSASPSVTYRKKLERRMN